MVDRSCLFPSNYERCVEKKMLTSEIIHRQGVLEKYFSDIGDYKGPFHRSLWIGHAELVKAIRQGVGLKLVKNRRSDTYYINSPKKSKVVNFNPDMLDLKDIEE